MNKEERTKITKVINTSKQLSKTESAKQLKADFIKAILAHNPKFDCKLTVL